MRLLKYSINEKGSVLVIVCAAMVFLLGSMAMVTDLGMMALAKSRLSNAVDAAALAGVQELPENQSMAVEKALVFAEENGIARDDIRVNVEGNSLIKVEGEQEIKFILAGILGLNKGKVSASASAVKGGVRAVHGAAPFAVPEHNYNFGEEYVLKQGAPGDKTLGPGNFGALDFSEIEKGAGGGANAYREFLKNGYPGEIKVGDKIPLESGNMSGPTKQAIEYLFEQCSSSPMCTPENYRPDCPRILIVPVYDPDEIDKWSDEITVVGFAAFLVSKIPGSGNKNVVSGYFLKTVPAPGCIYDIDQSQDNYGLEGIKLIE